MLISLELSKINSEFFWKRNIEKQKEETLFELIEENNKLPAKSINVYKNPIKSATENNLVLRDIKNGSLELREEIKNK